MKYTRLGIAALLAAVTLAAGAGPSRASCVPCGTEPCLPLPCTVAPSAVLMAPGVALFNVEDAVDAFVADVNRAGALGLLAQPSTAPCLIGVARNALLLAETRGCTATAASDPTVAANLNEAIQTFARLRDQLLALSGGGLLPLLGDSESISPVLSNCLIRLKCPTLGCFATAVDASGAPTTCAVTCELQRRDVARRLAQDLECARHLAALGFCFASVIDPGCG